MKNDRPNLIQLTDAQSNNAKGRDSHLHIEKATAGLALIAYSAVFRGWLAFFAGCAGTAILYQQVTSRGGQGAPRIPRSIRNSRSTMAPSPRPRQKQTAGAGS
ncbi:MAG: hypothetical protein H7144_06940 [Burkholderiales bacterium]|nr:hypothetical protein [Phycisphaerae bacterium]